MLYISSIINTLSPEERRNFIKLLKQNNKRKDTKNIQLFKLLEANTPRKDIEQKLYKKKASGAYNALTKRLQDNLIDFIASKSFETDSSQEMEILKLLLASRIFFEQKQFKIGFKTLQKAEQKAKYYDLFSVLQEIYYTKIQYAHQHPTLQLEDILKKLQYNRKLVLQEENLNILYASLQQKQWTSSEHILSFIKQQLQQLNISIQNELSYRSLFKILEALNNTAHIQRKHHQLLPFVTELYGQLQNKENLAEKHLYYHIYILYYVANSYFRNKEFQRSMQYLELMHMYMMKQKNKYYKTFLPQYTLLLALNHNYTGQPEAAIHTITSFDHKKQQDQLSYILDLQLSLAVFYLQQNNAKEAKQLFKKFYHSDTWYTEKAGMLWVLKKNLLEILLYIELEEIELAASRLARFRKKHIPFLKEHNETRIIEFVKLVNEYYKNPEVFSSSKYNDETIDELLSLKTANEDIFEISFYAWLKSKIHQTDIYQTTLALVQKP